MAERPPKKTDGPTMLDGDWIAQLQVECEGELLCFEVYRQDSGGLAAVCDKYPAMMLYFRELSELEPTARAIAPEFIRCSESTRQAS